MGLYDLMTTINLDCQELTNRLDKDWHNIYLHECGNSVETGLWQLILDGNELYYGTLPEINAIVKSMLILNDNRFEGITLKGDRR